MKLNLEKLKLEPGDIVVATLPTVPGRPKSTTQIKKVAEELRKVVPQGCGHRFVVVYDDVKFAKLADLITPEELHRMNERMEQRFLATPGVGLPVQSKEGTE